MKVIVILTHFVFLSQLVFWYGQFGSNVPVFWLGLGADNLRSYSWFLYPPNCDSCASRQVRAYQQIHSGGQTIGGNAAIKTIKV